jgi:hypothetical protein
VTDQAFEVSIVAHTLDLAAGKRLVQVVQVACELGPDLFYVGASTRRPREAPREDSRIAQEIARRAAADVTAATDDDVEGLVLLLAGWLGDDSAREAIADVVADLGCLPGSVARVLSQVAGAETS